MQLFCIALLFVVVPLFSDIVTASDISLRGVDPEFASHYAGDIFTCLDGALTVQRSAVNDDYCDCFDGSDEPGTAACSNGTFYCHNRGFRPQNLPSFFVNDAVCDCCDGSDEEDGKCTNTCLDLGEELRQQLKEKQDVYASALKEKLSRLDNTESISEGWKQELKSCIDEIDRQKERCDALQQDLHVLQKEEKEQRQSEEEAKRDAATNASDNETPQQDSGDSEKTVQDDPEGSEKNDESDEGKPIVTEDTISVDAEDNDDAEAEAEGEYTTEDDSEQPLNDDDDGEEDDEGEEHEEEEDVSTVEEEHDNTTEEKDEEEEETSLLKRMQKRVTSLFSKRKGKKRHLQKTPSHREGKSRKEESSLTKLRREHSNEKRELRNLETKRDALRSKIDRDYGPQSKFISLADKCFELKQDKYTYEICPFDKASQKERHNTVNLGKYEGFGDLYEWMEFHHGQSCSHGKSRSLRVHFHCGQEDSIDFVSEPNICEYLANFSTPIACSEAEFELLKKEADHLGMSMKDEL